ncbi:MAG: bacteriohemerythrin [Bacteroidales bacterium]
MDFFQNINIKTKIFSGIFLIILIYLVLIFWQFSILVRIDYNQQIQKSTQESIEMVKNISTVNMGEMNRILESVQSTEIENIESIYETHGFETRNLGPIYDSLFARIKFIFPDNANLGRIKVINNLNESQTAFKNVLIPYFDNIRLIKLDQLKKGDTFEPENEMAVGTTDSVKNSSSEIIEILPRSITGSSRSAQLSKLSQYYRQNHNQLRIQLDEIDKILREVFESSVFTIQGLSTRIKILNSLFFVISLLASLVVYFLISQTISKPLEELEDIAYKLSKGELTWHSVLVSSDEIGKMANALHALTDGLIKTSAFASEIGKGNFESEFEPLSNKDVLGNSLLEMRKSLQAAKEEENKRKVEDQERNWTTEGMAKFGEILRRHTENINLLSKDIIINLVKYLKANQGGIFILNDSDPNNIFLELIAAYAYNREKFITRRIQVGEGLVGGAAVEKYTVYMTDLPQEYIEIESGLGGANPNSLLIVPLKLENAVLGVIELASFNPLKKYEIELVERIGESIASTLSTAKINTRTAELLEQSRIQTQEMQEQDEEMRQNMEEMITAQEESVRREEELRKEVAELEQLRINLTDKDKKQRTRLEELARQNSLLTDEVEMIVSQINRAFETSFEALVLIDNDRKIQFINPVAEELFEYNKTEILGQNFKIFTTDETYKELEESILLYFQTGRKGLIDKKREIQIINKSGILVPVMIVMADFDIRGSRRIAMFIRNLSEIERLENQLEKVNETLMSKVFDYSTYVTMLENFIKRSGMMVPGDIEVQSDLINWNDSYSIELVIIDQQHKKWIEFINILYKSYKAKAPKADIQENISKLLDYTDYHFGFEEKYLEDFNCNTYETQKKEHASFIATIKKHFALFENGDMDVVYKLIIYLNNWVINHIQNEDKRYVECFKLNGLS